MNLPVPQHGSRVGSAVQQLVNFVVHTIAIIIGWQIDSLANVSGFATVDDLSIPDGSGKFVRSLKDTFHLDKTSTAVVDGITVVATMSNTGRWVRDLQPNAVWGSQATWYVDPLTGSDENLGTTALTALATFAEARRRIEPIGVLVPMTIYIVSDLAPTDLVGMDCGGELLTIEGVPTVLRTGEVVAYLKDPAANNPGHLSDATWTVADVLHKHVLFTSGVAAGMGCWVLEDLGAGDSRVSTVLTDTYAFPAVAAPAPGDTFEVRSFPSVRIQTCFTYDGMLQVAHIDAGTGLVTEITCESIFRTCNIAISAKSPITKLYGIIGRLSSIHSTYVYGGALGSVQSALGYIWYNFDPIFDAGVPATIHSVSLYASFVRVAGDLYLFGNWGTRVIQLFPFANFQAGAGAIRGDITGTTYVIQMQDESDFIITSAGASNTVTEKTIQLVGSGVTLELDTDLPLFDPHSGCTVGYSDNTTGAIGSRTAGIKGAIGAAATVFALPDLTSSATNDMPLVVTNRSFARNLRCRLGTAPGGADTVVVTVFLGPAGGPGVATAITLTFGPADTFKEDITHAVLVDPGEELSFEVVSSGAVAANLSISLEAG